MTSVHISIALFLQITITPQNLPSTCILPKPMLSASQAPTYQPFTTIFLNTITPTLQMTKLRDFKITNKASKWQS